MRRNRAENDASHAKLTRRAALLGGAQDGVQVTVTVTETIDGGAGRAWTVTRFVPEGE